MLSLLGLIQMTLGKSCWPVCGCTSASVWLYVNASRENGESARVHLTRPNRTHSLAEEESLWMVNRYYLGDAALLACGFRLRWDMMYLPVRINADETCMFKAHTWS